MEFSSILVNKAISLAEIAAIAESGYGIMVKAVVDIKQEIMVIGSELHVDEESVLLDLGSKQEDLWGINIFHAQPRTEWIQFDSMINLRPSQNNRSRSVEDPQIQQRIRGIIDKLISK